MWYRNTLLRHEPHQELQTSAKQQPTAFSCCCAETELRWIQINPDVTTFSREFSNTAARLKKDRNSLFKRIVTASRVLSVNSNRHKSWHMFTLTPYITNSWRSFPAGAVEKFGRRGKISGSSFPNFLLLERIWTSKKLYLFIGVGKGLYFLCLLFI